MKYDNKREENNSKGCEKYPLTLTLITGRSWFPTTCSFIRILRGPPLMRQKKCWRIRIVFCAAGCRKRLASSQEDEGGDQR